MAKGGASGFGKQNESLVSLRKNKRNSFLLFTSVGRSLNSIEIGGKIEQRRFSEQKTSK